MKTLFASALIALTLGVTSNSFAEDNERTTNAPTAKASFQTGIYSSVDGTRLNVNVNKVKGSKVTILLKNTKGDLLEFQRLGKNEEQLRTRFDLRALQDGTYQVEITDGKTKQVQEVRLQSNTPANELHREISLK